MGLSNSAFISSSAIKTRLAKGYLPVANGKGGYHEIAAPQFEFGILPAGNLYTTADDLGRFLSCLFAEGRASSNAILKASTLEQMFTPQLTQETNGFGLGFNIGSFQGHKTINHMGAVYGFTSMVSGMPKEKLGVVVLCNDDIVVGSVRKLTSAGLSALLEARLGQTTPEQPATAQVSIDDLAFFAGDFESESFWAEVRPANGVLEVNLSGQRMTLRPLGGPKFQANGRLANEAPVQFEEILDGRAASFTFMGARFRRVDPKSTTEIPPEWNKFLGSYGPDFIPFIVTVKHGHLYAMTENEYDNRLWPINRTVFKMPPGIYTDEHVVFQLDAKGNVHTAVLANMPLKRRKT